MKKISFLFICFLLISSAGCGPKEHTLRIMSYNIFIGKGMDEVISLERIASVINKVDPDFVGLQEVDSIAERSNWVDQAKELARLTGMHYVFAPATERSKGLYGIAALSKKKPLSYSNYSIPATEEPRTFVVIDYGDYVLCNTHFSLRAESRMQSIEKINEIVGNEKKPIIITGDFNMTPITEEFKLMNENWTLLSDSSVKTFPANEPKWTLDYIFGSKKNPFTVTNKVVLNEPVASDHLPIYIDVSFHN